MMNVVKIASTKGRASIDYPHERWSCLSYPYVHYGLRWTRGPIEYEISNDRSINKDNFHRN